MFRKRKPVAPRESEPRDAASSDAECAERHRPADPPPDAGPSAVVEETEPAAPAGSETTSQRHGLFDKLFSRLRASREAILEKTISILKRRRRIDKELLDDLEETLISADVGVETTVRLVDRLRDEVKFQKKTGSDDVAWLTGTLKQIIASMIAIEDRSLKISSNGPTVYLVVGVNGVGKTTAIGKLAHRFQQAGKKVLVVAADTFRAAAIDQLQIWAERAGADIIRGQEGADPSSVVYDAVRAARSQGYDIVIIDTAGRLHTKYNLMQELAKMARVVGGEFPGAPHETLLVLDASTGQNAIQQARRFTDSCPVTGIILTKLDGTAKGGVTIAIHNQLKIPVKLIGVGERIDDLEVFDPDAFLDALLGEGETKEISA